MHTYLKQLIILLVLVTINAPSATDIGTQLTTNNIYTAIDKKDYFAVQQIAKQLNLETINDRGETPLHYAARKNDLQSLDILIRAGADVNTKNTAGYTALTKAISSKREGIVRELIRAGADVYAMDASAMSPLERMTEPTCHGNIVHWGTETELLLDDPYNTALAEPPAATAEKFDCPKIAMKPQDDRDSKWQSWRLGYQSFPEGKTLHNGQVVLTCDVDIKNNSASLHLKNVYYDSCTIQDHSWACSGHDGGTHQYKNPTMTAHIIGDSLFVAADKQTFTYKATTSNLQPNGGVYLATEYALPLQVAYLTLTDEYDFDSCKMFKGSWYCQKN